MAVDVKTSGSVTRRLREIGSRSQFAYELLIAPWPPFALFLVAAGAIGGMTPLLQIKIISGLINVLTLQAGGLRAVHRASPLQTISPHLPWLFLLICMRIIDWMISTETFRWYLAAQLNERVRERFDRLFYRKALSLGLEWFESAAYYDTLQRARRAMDPGTVSEHLAGMQRFLSLALGCIAVLWALGRVHWMIPLLLLPHFHGFGANESQPSRLLVFQTGDLRF